jgi:regulator of protease activity HflC (stomatin/prohibitin superfamily)
MSAAIAAQPVSQERPVKVQNGWFMLVILVILIAFAIWTFLRGAESAQPQAVVLTGILATIALPFFLAGFFTLQPNESRVLVLFGDYKGTVRTEGFHWGNPFYSNGPSSRVAHARGEKTEVIAQAKKHPRMKVSLRARNLNGAQLKVNDKRGNPIEIAAVVVWRVQDTAQALFDVDDYEEYVSIQSESAVRHLCSQYAYDHGENDEQSEITLRAGTEEVSKALMEELQVRLARAGVTVEEARLTHLAYAPEVAQAMLRRQQAEAVLAARSKIVRGAVSMVRMALNDLATSGVVEFDNDRKAAMVSNLMVVLCGDSEAKPIINTGTLYS